MPSPRLLSIGHRGTAGPFPENTLPSFRHAVELGADMVETDLRLCGSGELVLVHDDVITDRDGRHRLRHLAAKELGERFDIPTFATLVDWARGKCGVMADLKEEGFEEELVQALGALPRDQVIIAGATPASRDRLRTCDASLRLAATLEVPPPGGLTDRFLDSIDTEAVTWEHGMLSPEIVKGLHERRRAVYAWTVNDAARMRELIDMGVDGIITDRVDLLARLLRSG
jgi:glycerophosphoryl diester phosphodiesterase